MAHPADGIFIHMVKQRRVGIEVHVGFSIFAHFGSLHLTPQQICHQLGSVTDSKHRNPKQKNLRAAVRSVLQINRIRAAGKNDALILLFPQLLYRSFVGFNLAVNIAFTNTARDQLAVLSSEIHHQYGFSCIFQAIHSFVVRVFQR